jgi:hypothetical protein
MTKARWTLPPASCPLSSVHCELALLPGAGPLPEVVKDFNSVGQSCLQGSGLPVVPRCPKPWRTAPSAKCSCPTPLWAVCAHEPPSRGLSSRDVWFGLTLEEQNTGHSLCPREAQSLLGESHVKSFKAVAKTP